MPERVGFVGLGEMGLPMALNAVESGRSVVGFDVDGERSAAARLAGVPTADGLAEIADTGTVVVIVRTLPQVEAVLFGAGGLLERPRPGLLVLVMSTIDPESMAALAERAAPLGAEVLDAPVSGGVRGAEAGTLAIMASGSLRAYERAHPLLDVFGQTVRCVGERPGLGQAAKLVNQLLMTVGLAGAAEGLALAEAYGLERSRLLEVLCAGTGSSWVLEHWDWMTSLWQEYRPGNALDVLEKDVRALLGGAERSGCEVPLAAASFQRLLGLWEPYLRDRAPGRRGPARSAAVSGADGGGPSAVVRRRERRLVGLRSAMAEAGYEVLVVAGRGVISQYGFLEYVSGYCPVVRAAYAVVGADGDVTLVVPTAADAWYARERAALADVRVAGQGDVMSEYDELAAGVAAAVGDHGGARARVGVVGLRHIVPVADYELLRARLPAARLVDATALLAAVKAVKDDEDVQELRRTAAIADAGVEACLSVLRAGSTGWEVAAATERAVRQEGARGEVLIFLSRDPYFLARPDERPFADGDLVTAYVELTGPSGYWLERADLIAVGALDGAASALAEAALTALHSAERELRVGRTAGDVARSIDLHVEERGLRSGIWHGHGVGVDHDLPVLTASDSTVLVERMVLSVHPNFATADETLGASVADTYVVGGDGPERLSRLPQELHRR